MRNIIATAALTAALILGAQSATAHHEPNPFLHPCKSEGSNGCYWDASTMGNGAGRSYIVTSRGQVFYFSPSMSSDPHHPFTK